MEAVIGIVGGGATVLAVVAVIIAIRLARSRSDRSDVATDQLLKQVERADAAATRGLELEKNLSVAVANTTRLEAALATANQHVASVEASAAALEESFHDLVNATITSGQPAAVAAIQTAATLAASQLRAALGRVRASTATVPDVPAAAPAGGPDRREDPGLPVRPDGSGSPQP